MTNMSKFPSETFDVVIDKACMDAIMTGEGDVWNHNPSVIKMTYQTCKEVSRVLKSPTGVFMQISLAQPHFRKKYLLGQHPCHEDAGDKEKEADNYERQKMLQQQDHVCPFGWDCQVEEVGGETAGCFNHFLYIMRKTNIIDS